MSTLTKNNKRGFRIGSTPLFYAFVLLNLVPNLFLLFTEPFNVTGKLLLLFLPLGFYLILSSLHKRVGFIQLLLGPLLFFFHAFQLVVFVLFKEDVIAVDMFLNLVTTNPNEAGELLNSILAPTLIVCAVYLFFIYLIIRSFRTKTNYSVSFRKNNAIAGGVIVVLSLFLFPSAKDVNTGTFTAYQNIYPTNVFYNLGFAANKFYKVRQYPKTSADFTFDAIKKPLATDDREIYVIVVGETSRPDHWGIYGYERNTTPHLANDSSIVHFNDVMTQANATHKSVSILLSAVCAENYSEIYNQKSIVNAFKEVGFTTVFLSNQAENSSFVEFYSREADYSDFYRSNYAPTNRLDGVLVDRLEHYIDSIPDNLFVIMHTYGSHFNYSERYSEEFSLFKPDHVTRIDPKNRPSMINAYDNSILYTDHILHRVSQTLESSGSHSSYLYISDHGEDIMDDSRGRFLHASPNPTYYQLRVPLVTWFSSKFKEAKADKVEAAQSNSLKPISTNVVFHTLLDMADIDTEYFTKERSLVNEKFRVTKRMYLGDHDDPVHYYNTNLKKQDKEMIRKKGLSIE